MSEVVLIEDYFTPNMHVHALSQQNILWFWFLITKMSVETGCQANRVFIDSFNVIDTNNENLWESDQTQHGVDSGYIFTLIGSIKLM